MHGQRDQLSFFDGKEKQKLNDEIERLEKSREQAVQHYENKYGIELQEHEKYLEDLEAK